MYPLGLGTRGARAGRWMIRRVGATVMAGTVAATGTTAGGTNTGGVAAAAFVSAEELEVTVEVERALARRVTL